MKLNFTGNWFIDLGTLGFVNLMEEVYGWDMEELKEKILLEEKIVFYGLFPIAYLRHWLTVRNYKIPEEQTKYEEVKLKLERYESPQQIFDKVWWDYIVPMFKKAWVETVTKKLLEKQEINKDWENYLTVYPSNFVKKLKNLLNDYKNDSNFKNLLGKKEVKSLTIDDLKKIEKVIVKQSLNNPLNGDLKSFYCSLQELKNSLLEHWENLSKEAVKINDKSRILFRLPIDHGFFKNFMFFNQNKNIWEQKQLMYKLIKFDINETSLQKIDKAINKLFPSDKKFPNETYTKFSTRNLNDTDNLFVFLLCFPEAFNRISGLNIAFYSNSLEFSYKVNKKIKLATNQETVKGSSILNFTWRQLVDILWEFKSKWTLENMYIIQYKKLDNQSQQDVEYLGINKLQAEFIIDDKIRDTLNTTIKVIDKGSSDNNPNKWLLQEFIKNKPLLPIFYRKLGLHFGRKDSKNKKNEKFENTDALIYSAALDKVIAELVNKKTSLFSDDFLNRSPSVLEKAKDTIQRYFYLMFTTKKLFSQESFDARKSFAYQLFSRLRKNQKYPFVNELLKELNGKNIQGVESLIKHTFENILADDNTWQSEAIPILAGLIGDEKNE